MSNVILSSEMIAAWIRGSARGGNSYRTRWESPAFEYVDCQDRQSDGRVRSDVAPNIEREDIPDLGYALREQLLGDPPLTSVGTATRSFEFLARLDWPESEFSERSDVLADIAYLLSVRTRAQNDYPTAQHWEARCVQLLLETEPSGTFLRNRAENNDSRADWRFLARPAVFLGLCHQLERERNHRPLVARELVTSLFETSGTLMVPTEELCYLRASLAHSAGVATFHLGEFEESALWLDKARRLFRQTSYPLPFLVSVAGTELISKHARYQWNEVLEVVGPLICIAKKLGMTRQTATLRVLRAHTLKEVSRHEEALREFQAVDSEHVDLDPTLHSSLLIAMAETQYMLGDLEGAAGSCGRAAVAATRSGAPLIWGFLHSLTGQVLRDSGRVEEAIQAFDRSIAAYASVGIAGLQAYGMILSAEMLLGLGRWQQGVPRLLAAISILRAMKIDRKVAVAVELLRAAINSGLAPSQQAVRELRQVLGPLPR